MENNLDSFTKLAVATTSEQKLLYLEEVLNELDLDFNITSINVNSDVSEQPMTEQETKQGSINRALNALNQVNNTDLSLGIEVGYHQNDVGDYELFCFATTIKKGGEISSRESLRMSLPEYHQAVLREGKDLGDYVERYIEESTDDESKKIGENIRSREIIIKAAIRSVLADYVV